MKTSRTRAVRPFEWAFPSRPVRRELLSCVPPGDTYRPPLLFVHGAHHGAWCYMEHWLPAAAERGYPAYAVSLRGNGASDGVDRLRRTTLHDYVHDVVQAAASLPRQAILVGHGLGALIVARALARYPARGAALLAPVPLGPGLGLLANLARREPAATARRVLGMTPAHPAEHLFHEPGPAAADYVARLGPASPLVQYQVIFHRRPEPPLGSPPVLVLGAAEDRLIPAGSVARAARFYGTEAVVVPGVGHDLMLDRDWERALVTLLDWVDARPAVHG